MADEPGRVRRATDSFGLEVERLLKQLPGAEPPAPRESASAPTPGPARPATKPLIGTSPSDSAVGAWLRTLTALALAVAVYFWPYWNGCGLPLAVYGCVVATVLVSGAWASWSAWRWRLGVAHLIGLFVVFWGVVLAAEVLLPRIGYAATELAWRCGG